MAGHSKWANIKHRKQLLDNKRSKLFHKLSKDLEQALKGGNDIKTNSVLRNVLLKMKSANMSKEIIERALKKSQVEIIENNFFWLTAIFQKQIFFICKLNDKNKILATQEFTKFLKKNETEVLPISALKSYFKEVFEVFLFDVSETILEEIITNFNIIDFIVDTVNQKWILFFENSQNLKEFQNFLLEKKIKQYQFQKGYLPIVKIEVDTFLKEEFFVLCKKIMKTKNCSLIVDNLVK